MNRVDFRQNYQKIAQFFVNLLLIVTKIIFLNVFFMCKICVYHSKIIINAPTKRL